MPVKPLSQHLLIAAFCLFFALGSLLLFWQNERERDPAFEKHWWLVAFTEPDNEESLDFRLENYTQAESFTYRILRENVVLEEETLLIPPGATKEVMVSIPQKSTAIEVMHENEKKSIYRK